VGVATDYAFAAVAPKAAAMPRNMGSAGKKLWKSIADRYVLDQHEVLLLLQACRCADTLDAIAAELATAELTVRNRFEELVTHPLVTEQRQQAITYARLVAALRLPDGEEQDARRPQRRSARGTYGVRGVA
jgi:hypothetical protein